MKFLTFTFIFAFSAIGFLSAQGNIPLPTHEVTQVTYNASVPLANSSETFNYYDNNGNLYESKINGWDGTNWTLNLRIYYTLNASGKPVQILNRKWNAINATLTDNFRTILAYHTDGQENYRKEEAWDDATSTWGLNYLKTSVFGPNNKVQETTAQYYNNGLELEGTRTTYTYDGSDRVSTTISETRTNGAWQNSQKTDYTYNGVATDFAVSVIADWDAANGVWKQFTARNTQTITSTQRLTLTENFDGLTWNPSARVTVTYNDNEQVLKYESETWRPDLMAWNTQLKYENTYNNDQSIAQFNFYLADFISGALFHFTKADFDYGIYAVSTQAPVLQAKVNISPNPSADFVNVKVEGQDGAVIKLLDVRGQLITSTQTIGNSARISLLNQPAGMYFVKIMQGGASKVLSVVKN